MTQQEFQTRYKYNPSTDCIGEGGFGKVYKAYDTHLDKWVAIKVAEVKSGLEQVRLKKEVEIVSKLPSHPNIANYEACYTFSSFTGEYDFAVLQYYEEGNLQQLIDSGKLNQTQKEALLRQILEGVGFLHNQDIIHRDLKPQNILIAKRSDEYIPKITDFGISKKLDLNNSSVFTNSLAGAGTMAYASPEQLLGKTIKKNTDLWSFGVIVCQVFTGKLPFSVGRDGINSEAGRIELYKQIVNGTVSFSNNSIPANWQQLIKKCIVVDNNVRATKAEICISILSNSGYLQNINNQNTIISQDTIVVVDSVYDESTFKIIVINEFCGFVDLQGRKITPIKYNYCKLFKEGMAVVCLNGKYGFIDKYGNEIISLHYDIAESFNEGIARVKLDGKHSFIDKTGKEIIPLKCDYATSFKYGLSVVYFNDKKGVVDKLGRETIPIRYDSIDLFSDKLIIVKLNNKFGLFNTQGVEITPVKYEQIYDGGEGTLCVESNNKYGSLDNLGREITPLKYDDSIWFNEGLAPVELNGKFGFINKQGQIVIQIKYHSCPNN